MTDWKSKLAAYLHDPPSKCLDISTHGKRSDAAFKQAGFVNEEEIGAYLKQADHAGAAEDRLPFPGSRAGGLQGAFDGRRNTFRHPLRGPRPGQARGPADYASPSDRGWTTPAAGERARWEGRNTDIQPLPAAATDLRAWPCGGAVLHFSA